MIWFAQLEKEQKDWRLWSYTILSNVGVRHIFFHLHLLDHFLPLDSIQWLFDSIVMYYSS